MLLELVDMDTKDLLTKIFYLEVINILIWATIAKIGAFKNSHSFQLGLNICQNT